jgi:hypothetical protein
MKHAQTETTAWSKTYTLPARRHAKSRATEEPGGVGTHFMIGRSQPELFDLAVERPLADAEHLGGFLAVAGG